MKLLIPLSNISLSVERGDRLHQNLALVRYHHKIEKRIIREFLCYLIEFYPSMLNKNFAFDCNKIINSI